MICGRGKISTETRHSDKPLDINKTDHPLFLKEKKLKGRGKHEGIKLHISYSISVLPYKFTV